MPDGMGMPLASPPASGMTSPADAGLLSRARLQLGTALKLIKEAVPQLDLNSDEGKAAVTALKALANLDLAGSDGLNQTEYKAMRPLSQVGEQAGMPAPGAVTPMGLPPMGPSTMMGA